MEMSKSMQQAVDWLDRVGAQTNRCPPNLVAGFSDEVDRLQVDSFRMRARARAILARGDAYFDAWATNGISPDSAQARKAAEYLPQLKDSFVKIKLTGHQTGGAFTNFFSGLRKIRVQLQQNPGATETTETHELMRATRDYGMHVTQKLGDLRDELDKVIPVLERAKAEKL
jgi:hypothetical protein